MRIAIIGAGFTGLSTAYRLLQKSHQVIIFEKEPDVGGLAAGFTKNNWDWTLEKSYHHIFTNDFSILKLAKDIHQPIIILKPRTDVFIDGQTFQFDNPSSILKFPYLTFLERARFGLALAYLKFNSNYKQFENTRALSWLRHTIGKKATSLIWEPLFAGKFEKFKEDISLTWFWARIKKRTSSLAYPIGGFKAFTDKLSNEIKKLGGEILLKTEITDLDSLQKSFDKIIVTLPTPMFLKITGNLPKDYVKKLSSIHHLSALTLILVLKEPFLKNTYWLNITDKSYPFLALVEHTNFMDPNHYGGTHILYIGNYLPPNHPYLKMSTEELLKIYAPYLKKINPNYSLPPVACYLFSQPFAQPVVTVGYQKFIPTFETPLKNVFLANMDMVYPWDRGINYAVEMGKNVVKLI
ncbi:NAD(P)/FAD-dependent oxidoreductase [Patescibacteria group bacterium]|nr:NAD(P)/FAD-dependent oxidoreductase [Patescibacteria group bacterium]